MISEANATAASNATASVPNTISPATIYTLVPKATLLYPTIKPTNFLSSHPPENPKEEPNSIQYPTSSDYPKTESSYLTETSPTELPKKNL